MLNELLAGLIDCALPLCGDRHRYDMHLFTEIKYLRSRSLEVIRIHRAAMSGRPWRGREVCCGPERDVEPSTSCEIEAVN